MTDNGTRLAEPETSPELLTVLRITRRVWELQMALREAVQMLQQAEHALAQKAPEVPALKEGG